MRQLFSAVAQVNIVYEANNGETLDDVKARMESHVESGETFPIHKVLSVTESRGPEFTVISVKELERLADRDFKLSCLEGGGVDNWEGYDFAMEEYWKEDE